MILSFLDFLVMGGLLTLTMGPVLALAYKIKTNDLHHIDLKIDALTEHVTASVRRIETRLDEHIREHERV